MSNLQKSITVLSLEKYHRWLEDAAIDADTKNQLRSIMNQEQKIRDRFYKELEFGTAGMRGVMGAGTNRMNIYTVGKATQGLTQFLKKHSSKSHSVAIAYDSRNRSQEFAIEAALVLAGSGIVSYVFESLRPTPELSFAVRELKASAGIVITASHNPPEYNGYKVYDENGCQYLPNLALQITDEIQTVTSFSQITKISRGQAEDSGLLRWIGSEIDETYIQALVGQSRLPKEMIKSCDLKIVYTPLHGAGNKVVRSVLQAAGYNEVYVVPEQENADPRFPTVKVPNPEERESFTCAIRLANENNADIIVATDPDCDRMGVAVKNKHGEYTVLTGNQTGAILIHYLLSDMKEKGELRDNGAIIKTIVTNELGAKIARKYGVTAINTLTGFKYIGEKITEYSNSGKYRFLFGYEESYGYLLGTHCRDKDAVVASMFICEAAAYFKSLGKTLNDVLESLYLEHGFYIDEVASVTMAGVDGANQLKTIMEHFREQPFSEVNGIAVKEIQDYKTGIGDLPKEDVLKYILADDSWLCFRPSGTEPKLKIYVCAYGATEQETAKKLISMSVNIKSKVAKGQ